MDKNTQVIIWALGLVLIGSLLIGKNVRDYLKKHEKFDIKTFSKSMLHSIVIGNTMIFGLLFFWIGVSILIFRN